jgi:hypothetical protein
VEVVGVWVGQVQAHTYLLLLLLWLLLLLLLLLLRVLPPPVFINLVDLCRNCYAN